MRASPGEPGWPQPKELDHGATKTERGGQVDVHAKVGFSTPSLGRSSLPRLRHLYSLRITCVTLGSS